VVNIILKKDFEGLQLICRLPSPTIISMASSTIAAAGLQFGGWQGNLTIYGEYMHRDPNVRPP
jgi:hypothetical protein